MDKIKYLDRGRDPCWFEAPTDAMLWSSLLAWNHYKESKWEREAMTQCPHCRSDWPRRYRKDQLKVVHAAVHKCGGCSELYAVLCGDLQMETYPGLKTSPEEPGTEQYLLDKMTEEFPGHDFVAEAQDGTVRILAASDNEQTCSPPMLDAMKYIAQQHVAVGVCVEVRDFGASSEVPSLVETMSTMFGGHSFRFFRGAGGMAPELTVARDDGGTCPEWSLDEMKDEMVKITGGYADVFDKNAKPIETTVLSGTIVNVSIHKEDASGLKLETYPTPFPGVNQEQKREGLALVEKWKETRADFASAEEALMNFSGNTGVEGCLRVNGKEPFPWSAPTRLRESDKKIIVDYIEFLGNLAAYEPPPETLADKACMAVRQCSSYGCYIQSDQCDGCNYRLICAGETDRRVRAI